MAKQAGFMDRGKVIRGVPERNVAWTLFDVKRKQGTKGAEYDARSLKYGNAMLKKGMK